jgi:hypothetical protein
LGDIPRQWSHLSILHVSPALTGHAEVKFSASCPALNGSTIMYFDDVSFESDDIFTADFEPPGG